MSLEAYRLPSLKDKFKAQEEQREAEEKAAWAEKAKKKAKVEPIKGKKSKKK